MLLPIVHPAAAHLMPHKRKSSSHGQAADLNPQPSAAEFLPESSGESLRLPCWPPDWPEIADSISRAVQRGDWGRYRGQSVAELTERIRQGCCVSHCRLVASGSLGVELALRSCGIGNQDQVAMCGYDYPGNFRAIELLGAQPVLVDADPKGYSIDPAQLQLLPGSNIRAVIVSHLYGLAAQIGKIREICDQNHWLLIEDACQTPLMKIDGRIAGNWGDVGVLSFGGSKPLTAGNGGAVMSNRDDLASRLNAWIDRPSDSSAMSELQAAALMPQWDRLQECNQIRWETTRQILQHVDWIRVAMGNRIPDANATFYKLAFLTPCRDALLQTVTDLKLPIGPGYRSMHRSSDRRCSKVGNLENCRSLGEQVSLLDHAALLATGLQRERLIALLCELEPG